MEASQVLPGEVFLIGPRHLLDKLEDISSGEYLIPTRPIKLSGARATAVVTVELVLPDGVRPLKSDHRLVEATAAILEERDTLILDDVPISIISASRLEPSIEPKTARVQVEGPKSLLTMLDASQIVFRPETHYEERAGAVHNSVSIEGFISPRKGSALESRRRELQVLSVEPSRVRLTFPPAEDPGVIAP